MNRSAHEITVVCVLKGAMVNQAFDYGGGR